MRKVEFRLRDFQNKIVGYEKWYEGVLHAKDGYWVAKPQWLYSTDNFYWKPEYIEHRYKDQYTGLNDKNDKKVYNGDKVRGHGTWGATSDSEVVFSCDGARIEIGDNWINLSRFIDIEIIGNI